MKKEVFKLMMKIWLNQGSKSDKSYMTIREYDQILPKLWEKGWVFRVNQFYSEIEPQTGFHAVMENFLSNLCILEDTKF